MKRGWAGAFVLIGGASYGLLATFVNLAYGEGFKVGHIIGSQMFTGALFLWIIALFKRKAWNHLSWKTASQLILAGTLSGLTGMLYYSSMQTLPASIAIVLLFQFAWIGSLYDWIFKRQKPGKRMYISLAVILLGTLLAANVFAGGFEGFTVWGLILGLLSAFTFAGFIYVSGHVATQVTPWLRSPLMVTGAALIAFIVFPPSFFISGVLFEGLWKYTLLLAFFGAVVPTVFFTLGAPHLKGGVATILGSVELPVAVVMAWLVLKESVNLFQWLGVLLILVAIAVGELYTVKPKTKPHSVE